MNIFTVRLNIAMNLRDVKAVDICKATGLSKARMSQYMNGTYIPKQNALYALATALSVNVDWLSGHSDYMIESDRQFAELFTQLTDNQKKQVIDLMHSFL